MKRWYDSRARVTLKTVAAWLRVPWRKVTNFECLLVYQLMLPSEDKGRAPANPWEHSLRAAKICAAALGIGALFAVTGESQRSARFMDLPRLFTAVWDRNLHGPEALLQPVLSDHAAVPTVRHPQVPASSQS